MSYEKIFSDVKKDLDRALKLREEKKYGKFHSAHEGFGVLYEEVDEFWEEVRKKASKRSKKDMRNELIQIISVAMRIIDDLEL
jgi:NTP pyrophosphatase (non-canonical NTP hydrolase)